MSPVHNHGPEEGRGVECPEVRVNGQLVGECMLRELPHSVQPSLLSPEQVAELVRFARHGGVDGTCVYKTARYAEIIALCDEWTALRKALDEAPSWWLIEKPEPGGVYWWTGRANHLGIPAMWPEWFSKDANEAVRFRSKEDAFAVIRLMPEPWGKMVRPTEHLWMRPSHRKPDMSDQFPPNAWHKPSAQDVEKPPSLLSPEQVAEIREVWVRLEPRSIVQLCDSHEALRKALDEARKDSERLDWLDEEMFHDNSTTRDGHLGVVHFPPGMPWSPSLRHMIDAARSRVSSSPKND